MILKESILKHLEIDFIYGDKDSLDCFNFLNEERGHVPYAEEFINPILKYIRGKWSWRSKELKIDGSIYKDMELPFFFDDFSLTIVQGNSFGGNYIPMKNNFNEQTQNLKKMVIQLTVDGKSVELISIVRVMLFHEFLHAWEDVNRFRKKKEGLRDVVKRRKQNIRKDIIYNDDLKHLSYFLSYEEKNAYIGELKADLIKMQDEIMGSKSGLETIEKTNVYKKLVKTEQCIRRLKNIENKGMQNELIMQWYELTNQEFIDYKNFYNYIFKKYNKFVKKFIDVSHKMVYEVFRENGVEVMVDDFSDYFEK